MALDGEREWLVGKALAPLVVATRAQLEALRAQQFPNAEPARFVAIWSAIAAILDTDPLLMSADDLMVPLRTRHGILEMNPKLAAIAALIRDQGKHLPPSSKRMWTLGDVVDYLCAARDSARRGPGAAP
jgi:hypothetical protein